jgi:hypothetical protein
MVTQPRAHFALMREPLDSVADRNFVWMDCMVFCSLNRESGMIRRYNPLFRMDWRGESLPADDSCRNHCFAPIFQRARMI